MKLCIGRCVKRYPGQVFKQDTVCDIFSDGNVYIGHNSVIGGTYPSAIGNGTMIRFTLGKGVPRDIARRWYSSNRHDISKIIAHWTISGDKGMLLGEGLAIKDSIEYSLYSNPLV